MSEVSLQHGMTRQMVAGQSMQTGMQILQASSLELKQLIRQALETNPLLEDVPDASPEALADEPSGDLDDVRMTAERVYGGRTPFRGGRGTAGFHV